MTNVLLGTLILSLNLKQLKPVATVHGIAFVSQISSTKLLHVLADHDCTGCPETFTVLAPSERTGQQLRKHRVAINAKHRSKPWESRLKAAKLSAIAGKIKARVFSSSVIDSESERTVEERIVRQACADVIPDKFVEAGCCVGGQLTLLTADVDLNILHEDGVTRAERSAVDEPIVGLSGPVIDDTCDSVCKECTKAMHAGKRPLKSLANRLWIGRVPWQLKDLSFAERMLIARGLLVKQWEYLMLELIDILMAAAPVVGRSQIYPIAAMINHR
ncbi:hypothetical protein C8J57DRAFT_1222769 [Mycena rebaudengoi]|nr:hypothetical protein C8J57DRAFT_1222769 [Mycena rebaudengoi]